MAAHHDKSSFRNPWPSRTSILSAISTICHLPLTRAEPFTTPGVRAVKTVPCEFERYESSRERDGRGALLATWLGHAGFLVQIPPRTGDDKPVRVLFDPIFAERASPVTWFGPKRWLPPPCSAEDLPHVDYIIISHNHYDHLDLETIQRVYHSDVTVLVPLGVKQIFLDSVPKVNTEHVHEMDWWDTMVFLDGIEVVCTPAQHNSGRGLRDQCKTLWASWVVRRASTSLYHAGDTGYATASGPCPAFSEIGKKYGPFDLAMIPIWRGASLSVLGQLGLRVRTEALLSTLHASPHDAVELAADVKAKHSIAMHFGTFCGSADEALEPLVLLEDALRKKGCTSVVPVTTWETDGGFRAIDVGHTVAIPLATIHND
ncbi:beta-lactamase superfamily domain-containing protein [Collybia nuda]|uniref:Beta-lactamase superfamily domain-containing protein n=1 Tax=Collybia nuda TaxID=64659 RepID=A0A9P5Y804_9AGAR|nr:beta-lactamase superfamily domain-containing protein [Collybia nuda]